VPASHRDGVDGLRSQLVGHLTKLLVRQLSKIRGGCKGVEKWGRRSHYWNTFARFMLGVNAIPDSGMQTQRAGANKAKNIPGQLEPKFAIGNPSGPGKSPTYADFALQMIN